MDQIKILINKRQRIFANKLFTGCSSERCEFGKTCHTDSKAAVRKRLLMVVLSNPVFTLQSLMGA